MWANKRGESESTRTGINIIRPSTYRQSVNNEWKNIMEKKIIIIYCVWWSNITKKIWKERWRDFFTVRRFTCIRRLLIFAFCRCLCWGWWYFKVCCVDKFYPSSRYPFILLSFPSLSLASSTSSCLTHLFIFSRKIGLSTFEDRKMKGRWRKNDGSKNQTTTKILHR
jgi:hypothetical protein